MSDAPRNPQATATRSFRRRGKKAVFALGALLIGLLPLVVTESILRWANVGRVTEARDPFIAFDGIRPLFEHNSDSGRYEIAPERQTFFRPDGFASEKPAEGFRIFCLGGSTVQGRPYAIETSFTTWLRLQLETAAPQRTWEVVNCGGVSYASYRLVPIMRELLEYQPDLFILCTGHNEFLEARTYGDVRQTPRWITWGHAQLTRLRTYNALRSLSIRLRGDPSSESTRPQLPTEVEALLDYRGGLEAYERDEHWRQATIAHFQHNVYHMISMAHQQGIPVLLVNPACNVKDTPPFKYAADEALTIKQQQRFDQLWEAAKREGIALSKRISLLRQAVAIDNRHAAVQFHLGRCYLNRGDLAAAKRHLTAAKDEDLCPLRILSEMSAIIDRAARDHRAPLVDAQGLFEQLTDDGITGDEWFLDHVHPSIRGHQRLAGAIFECMARQGWVRPTRDWEPSYEQLQLQHLQSLDAAYYLRGQQRLRGLRRWAQGRAERIRPGSAAPPR